MTAIVLAIFIAPAPFLGGKGDTGIENGGTWHRADGGAWDHVFVLQSDGTFVAWRKDSGRNTCRGRWSVSRGIKDGGDRCFGISISRGTGNAEHHGWNLETGKCFQWPYRAFKLTKIPDKKRTK